MSNLIFVYNSCSMQMYDFLHAKSKYLVLPQDQKYYSVMIDGLSHYYENITCLSGRPINRSLTKRLLWHREIETISNINYIYFQCLNYPVIRQIYLLFESFINCYRICSEYPDASVAVNILSISNAFGALLAAKILHHKTIGIVTDPLYDEKSALTFAIRKILMKIPNGYVFLTDEMHNLPWLNGKPYTVIEGLADIQLLNLSNFLVDKVKPRICLYAGAVERQYGLDRLVKAFIRTNISGWALWIYGNGSYADEIVAISKTYGNIYYGGVKLNKEIVMEEVHASLVVNPRPTDEEYTKYSFPSKNMEYMASGTPVLTTKLPGIPDSYLDFVYLFEDETIEGMTKTLLKVLNLPPEELHQMGAKAKKFVMDEKNNVMQARKIVELLKRLE